MRLLTQSLTRSLVRSQQINATRRTFTTLAQQIKRNVYNNNVTSKLNNNAVRSFASQSDDLSSEFAGIVLDTELDIDFQDQGMLYNHRYTLSTIVIMQHNANAIIN